MKKILSIALAIVLIACLFVLTGCEKAEEDVVIEDKTPTVIDRTNSKLQNEDDIKAQIEKSTEKYFEMLYGEKFGDFEIDSLSIFKGDEPEMAYVDLAENDYAFKLDYKIRPEKDSYIAELTETMGTYDEDNDWVVVKNAYGVMRYNEISDDYDVTAITPDNF